MSLTDAIIAKKLCNGGGGGSVPKPLTYDYMPEGYPKKTLGTVTLMVEQELAFALTSGSVYTAHPTEALDIVVGQTYKVNWDGTEYKCVAFAQAGEEIVLGNISIIGNGYDSGEPFLYMAEDFATLDTSASHTISVKRIEEIVTPVAEEFLPAPAFIVYKPNSGTYSSNLTTDALYKRLLDGGVVVFVNPVENEQSYLMVWVKRSDGRIDLNFPSSTGAIKVISLFPDGHIGPKPIA